MSVADIDQVIHEILQHCDREAKTLSSRAPWLRHECQDTIRHIMKHLELVGDTWDKKVHRVYACCARLQDLLIQTISMIICGDKCVIHGWGSSPIVAQQWTLLHILHTARTQGILHRAARQRCLPHVLLEADTATERVNKNYTHSTRARHTPTRLPRVPTAYGKLKWKTQELLAELKVRIIVTFAGHPLSKCGRLMSRALGVIVREVSQCTYTLCMPTMRGTRDMMSSLIRLRPQWEHSSHAEIDMYDQYWAISRRDVKAAFEWGLSRLRNKRHGHGIFEFSLSKLHRHLNRLGHALDETFDIVDETDVCTYLHWDLDHNTLLTICPMILTQSPVGVAIGGFLSSWEAELWCMWRESLSLH